MDELVRMSTYCIAPVLFRKFSLDIFREHISLHTNLWKWCAQLPGFTCCTSGVADGFGLEGISGISFGAEKKSSVCNEKLFNKHFPQQTAHVTCLYWRQLGMECQSQLMKSDFEMWNGDDTEMLYVDQKQDSVSPKELKFPFWKLYMSETISTCMCIGSKRDRTLIKGWWCFIMQETSFTLWDSKSTQNLVLIHRYVKNNQCNNDGRRRLSHQEEEWLCMWNDTWKEFIHMGWSAQNKHRAFHWVKATLPNVTLGHWKGWEVLGVKDSRMDSLVAAGRNDDSHKRAKS